MAEDHTFFRNPELGRQKYLAERDKATAHMQGQVDSVIDRLIKLLADNKGHIGAITFAVLAKHGDAMEVRPGEFSDGASAFCVATHGIAPLLTDQLRQLVSRTEGAVQGQREDIGVPLDIEQAMRKLMNPDGQ
jgi:hypothetical protein